MHYLQTFNAYHILYKSNLLYCAWEIFNINYFTNVFVAKHYQRNIFNGELFNVSEVFPFLHIQLK